MILNFKAYWNTLNSVPFVNETIPIVDNNQSLANFIRQEIVTVRPTIACADADIRAVKSGTGANKLRIMHLPVSTFVTSIQGESPELKVVIDRVRQEPQPVVNAFNRMMVAAAPTVENKHHGEKDLHTKSSTPNKRKAPDSSTPTPNKRKAPDSSTPKKKKEKKQSTPKGPKKVPVTFNDPDDLKGKRVAKYFDQDLFFGLIKGHEKDEGVTYWQVEYEDGDAEDFELKDVGEGFALYQKKKHLDTAPMEIENVADTASADAVKMDAEPVEEQKKGETVSIEKKNVEKEVTEKGTTEKDVTADNKSNNETEMKDIMPQDSLVVQNDETHLLV